MDVTRKSALTAQLEAQRKYEQSAQGIAVRKAYKQSAQGIAVRKAYKQSAERKAEKEAYNQSAQGIAVNEAYRKSEKAQEDTKKNNAIGGLNRLVTREYQQQRPFSRGQENHFRNFVKDPDKRPGQKGAFPASPGQDPREELKRLDALIVGQRKGTPQDEERYYDLQNTLGERSSESDDSRDRGYNELPPKKDK
jgi:hypothetical protein